MEWKNKGLELATSRTLQAGKPSAATKGRANLSKL